MEKKKDVNSRLVSLIRHQIILEKNSNPLGFSQTNLLRFDDVTLSPDYENTVSQDRVKLKSWTFDLCHAVDYFYNGFSQDAAINLTLLWQDIVIIFNWTGTTTTTFDKLLEMARHSTYRLLITVGLQLIDKSCPSVYPAQMKSLRVDEQLTIAQLFDQLSEDRTFESLSFDIKRRHLVTVHIIGKERDHVNTNLCLAVTDFEEKLQAQLNVFSEVISIKFIFREIKVSPLKVFNCPIHGHIKLSSLSVKVMDTPQFQRLRDISQLGSICYVFGGAASKRFEHCVGEGRHQWLWEGSPLDICKRV